MSLLNRPTKRLLALAGTTALLAVPWSPALAGDHDSGSSNDKQTICHANANDKKPYVVETPNKNGDVSGHADHTGPIWNPTLKAEHDWWGDIIPPFDYNDGGDAGHFDGLNWTADGQAWWNNGCRVPITGDVDKTNDANSDETFSDDETTTAEGTGVTFSVTVTNTSIVPAVITSVSDTVGDTPVTFTPTPDPVGTELAAGASTTFMFTITGYSPADGASKVNVVTVGLAHADDPENTGQASDDSTVRTVVPPPPAPDVSIVKTATASVAPGDAITWTLTVHNDGTVPAPGVTVTDALPFETTFVSAAGTGWTCVGTTQVSCTLDGDLAVDATATITVVATLDVGFTGTTVSNTAVVTPEDETPADNTSTAITDVTGGGGGGGGGEFTGGGGGFTGGGGGTALPRTGSAVTLAAGAGLLTLVVGVLLTTLVPRPRRSQR